MRFAGKDDVETCSKQNNLGEDGGPLVDLSKHVEGACIVVSLVVVPVEL